MRHYAFHQQTNVRSKKKKKMKGNEKKTKSKWKILPFCLKITVKKKQKID